MYLLGEKSTDFNSFSCFLPISYTADQLNGNVCFTSVGDFDVDSSLGL